MPTIGVLCPESEDRRNLVTLAGESGYLAHPAAGLPEALEVVRERRPSLMLVTDGPGQDAETLVRELSAVSPLLPVVVALKKRDATRAVKLMRSGACEVVAPPWTRDDLSACLSKTLRSYGTAFSIVRLKGRPLSVSIYFLAVAFFFVMAIGHVALQRRERLQEAALAKKNTWGLPYRHPAAASFAGSDLWVLDWFSQSLYAHSAKDLSVKRVTPFPGELPVSFSVGPDAVWSVTPEGRVTRRMKDETLRFLQEYEDAAPRSVALVFDGLYLWTVSDNPKVLRKHLNDGKLTVMGSWPYPGGKPAALAFDGTSLWSLDSAHRELVRHNIERPDEVTRRVPLPEYRDGLYQPVGLAWDGERFWTVADTVPAGTGPARLFEHALSQR